MRIGDRVNHYRHGAGTVVGIDTQTYSIPFVSVRLDASTDGLLLYVNPGHLLPEAAERHTRDKAAYICLDILEDAEIRHGARFAGQAQLQRIFEYLIGEIA